MGKVGRQFTRDKKTGKVTYRDEKKKKVTTFDPITLSKKGEKVEGSKQTKKEIVDGKLVTTAPTIELKKPEEKGRLEMIKDLGKEILTPTKESFSQTLTDEQKVSLDKAAVGGLVLGGSVAGTSIVTAGIKDFAGRLATKKAIQSGFAQQAAQATTTATRYAVNPKTNGLTKTIFSNAGLTIGAAGILVGIIGSYPFAGFIKEESLQTLGFATRAAMTAEDYEGAQKSIDQVNEILNPAVWEKIIAGTPYANVVKQLTEFYSAAATKNEIDQDALNKKISEIGQESDFEISRRESDEASIERRQEFADKESERYAQIEEENKAAKLEEAQVMQQVYRLRREGKFDEADQMETAFLSK